MPSRQSMRTSFALVGLLLLLPSALFGQGCVIARGGGAACHTNGSGFLEAGHWQINTAYRYFKSHRHFAGDDEQTHRSDQGTEVYNNSSYLDVTATYGVSSKLSLSLTIPTVHHDRSSMYEHLGNSSGQRFATQASGLGDLRFSGLYWVQDPMGDNRGNFAVGFGLKAPTGQAEVQDTFIKSAGPTLRYVDSSIQPGDSGWGYTVELQGYWRVKAGLSVYGNGFYLFNPEGRNETTGFSIPDGYMVRGGLDFRVDAVKGLSVSLGVRNEGVIAHDLFGNSRGSRRPGFAVSVEPGFTYARGRYSTALTVPIAVHRNRTTTYGATKAGDAAFADYTLNFSFGVKI